MDDSAEITKVTISESDARRLRDHIELISRLEEKRQRNKYIDVGGNLGRMQKAVNHVIYGRRGSGKSALIHEARDKCRTNNILTVHIDCELYKDHTFPKLLIEILQALLKGLQKEMPRTRFVPWTAAWRAKKRIALELKGLGDMMARPDELDVDVSRRRQESRSAGGSGGVKRGAAALDASYSRQTMREDTESFQARDNVIDKVQLKMQAFREVLEQALAATKQEHLFLFADDFYLINLRWQTDTVDYLHRMMKGSRTKFKLATIRFNSNLYERRAETIRGIQENVDHHTIELDYTLEDFSTTQDHLLQILKGVLTDAKVGLDSREFISKESLKRLVWASGGVPRDFLLIFASALGMMLQKDKASISVHEVYDASRRFLEKTKIPDLRGDVQTDEVGRLTNAWHWLQNRVVISGLTNVFLVDKDEAASLEGAMTVMRKLQDLKFIHVVAKDTTAANRDLKTHRYEAYAIDLGAYSHRLKAKNLKVTFREIDIAQIDPQGRRDAIRTGTVISLAEFSQALTADPGAVVLLDKSEVEDDAVETVQQKLNI